MEPARGRTRSTVAKAAMLTGLGSFLLGLVSMLAAFVFSFRLPKLEHVTPPDEFESTKLLVGLLSLGGLLAAASGAITTVVAWLFWRGAMPSDPPSAEDAPWR